MRPTIRFALTAALVACAGGPPAAAPRAPAPTPAPVTPSAAELGDRVGTADFRTSCAAAERDEMNRAVALLHSFFYDEARRRFEGIAGRDPACAMAEWGVAMTHWHPLWQAPRPDEMAAGLDAVRKGRALDPVTPRERAYMEAIEAFYAAKTGSNEPASQSCHGVVASDHVAGARAYEAKMETSSRASRTTSRRRYSTRSRSSRPIPPPTRRSSGRCGRRASSRSCPPRTPIIPGSRTT